jgi:hypothetical protein
MPKDMLAFNVEYLAAGDLDSNSEAMYEKIYGKAVDFLFIEYSNKSQMTEACPFSVPG